MVWTEVAVVSENPTVSDLTKSAPQVLVDLINEDNPSANLTTADITFGAPTDISGSNPQRNTEVTVTAVPGGAYGGSVNVRYNRISLPAIETAGAGAGLTLSFLKGAKTLLSEVMSDFNARFATNLVAGVDYDDAPLPEFEELPGEQHTIVLTARTQSLVYIGQITLIVRMDTVDLSSVITVEDLSGLTYVAPPPP